MKNRLIILFIFILGLFMPISSFKALEDIPGSSVDQFFYYKVDNNTGVCGEVIKSNAGDLPTFGWNSSQDTYVVGTTTRINGFTFNQNQEVYLKINFYVSDKSVFLKDQLEYSYGSLNQGFRVNVINGDTTYWDNPVSDFTKSYSYKVVGDGVEITQTLRFKANYSGTGVRIRWADCDSYESMALNNVYGKLYQFGINSVQYQVLSDDNNVIIDQNNVIIDQNQQIINGQLQTNDKIDEVNQSIENNLNSCRDSYNLFNLTKNFSTGFETTVIVDDSGFTINGKWFGYQIYNLKKNTDYNLSFDRNIIKQMTGTGLVRVAPSDDYNNLSSVIIQTNSDDFTFNTGNNDSIAIIFFAGITGNDTGEVRFSNVILNEGTTAKPYEPYGKKICKNKIDETNESINNLNDTLNDDDVDGATNEAGSFFENFTTDTFGLTSVITSPLNLIQSLSSKSCTPLSLPIPFVGGNFKLPCMSQIYSRYFGSFLDIYQIITFGIVSYYVCIRIFNLVKDFKNPEHDEIEVMDL